MLPQVPLELLLADFLRLTVVPIIPTMAEFFLLITSLVPVFVAVAVPVRVAGDSQIFPHPEEAEHGGNDTARGQPDGLTTRPGFTRDRFCQLIEASAVHV
jgi:hypothetical protein